MRVDNIYKTSAIIFIVSGVIVLLNMPSSAQIKAEVGDCVSGGDKPVSELQYMDEGSLKVEYCSAKAMSKLNSEAAAEMSDYAAKTLSRSYLLKSSEYLSLASKCNRYEELLGQVLRKDHSVDPYTISCDNGSN